MKRAPKRILVVLLAALLIASVASMSSCSPSGLLGIEDTVPQRQQATQMADPRLVASKADVISRFGHIVTVYDWRLTADNNFYAIVHYAQERDYDEQATQLISAVILAGRNLGATRSCFVDTWNRDGVQELLAMVCASSWTPGTATASKSYWRWSAPPAKH